MITLEPNALVWGIVGNLGGGKTLSGVELAVRCLRSGFAVVTNVNLHIDQICREYHIPWAKKLYFTVSLDDPSFADPKGGPWKWPCGDPRGSGGEKRVIVLLDEIAEWMDQYCNAKSPTIQNFWSWLRHSSKRSQDVVLICQRQSYIHKTVRTLVARWIWVDDLAVYRLPALKIKLPFCGGLVMQNVFDRNGSRVGMVSFIKKANAGRFYDTAQCLNQTGAAFASVYSVPQTKYRFSWSFLFLASSTLLYLLYLRFTT